MFEGEDYTIGEEERKERRDRDLGVDLEATIDNKIEFALVDFSGGNVDVAGAHADFSQKIGDLYSKYNSVQLIQGPQGPPGRDGLDGRDGLPGIQGNPGAKGEQGLQGPPGAPGQNGLNGQNGATGPQGIGVQSALVNANGELIVTLTNAVQINAGEVIGPAGKDGVDGINGTDGADGAPGRDGIDGQDGVDGQRGLQGAKGDNGVSVTNATINGAGNLILTLSDNTIINTGHVVGEQGIQGARGEMGFAGIDGEDGIGISTATVNQAGHLILTLSSGATIDTGLVKGIDGAKGDQGIQGPIGNTGPQGAAGVGISNVSVNGMYELIVTKTDNTTVNAGNVRGPAGATGANGSTIITGSGVPSNALGNDNDLYINTANYDLSRRSSGAWSVIGNIKGIQGIQGPAGADGAAVIYGTGAPLNSEGKNNDFYVDITNSRFYGPKSSGVWSSSYVSIIGPKGDKGDQGVKGDQGIQGIPGADGKTLRYGIGAPSNLLGNDNDFYIDAQNWFIYGPKSTTWPTGVSIKGAQGIAGQNGAAGADGNTILNGSGVPSNALGKNGDYYIRTDTWEIYGPKAAGAWPGGGTSIIGPAGQQGVKGDQGIQGVPGNAATIAVAGTTTAAPDASASVANEGTTSAASFRFTIPRGARWQTGSGAPVSQNGALSGDLYLNTANGDVYQWTTSWGSAVGNIRGAQGIQGVQGNTGNTGAAATIAAGSATALAPGSSPTVSNVGSSSNAVFNFGIPAGSRWTSGSGVPNSSSNLNGDYYLNLSNGDVYQWNGATWGSAIGNLRGPQGIQGNTGTTGNTGAAATATAGTTTTTAPGTSASVTNGGTTSAAVFNFNIPAGAQWFNGAGAPSGVAGMRANDYYLDTTSGDVYKYNGSTWGSAVGNIKGATGQTGSQPALGTGITTIGASNVDGVATTAARVDHVHAHGNQAGGSLHAVATTTTAGFMSAADKTKVDNRSIKWINVRDYGAKGDGTTDDAQAFRDAIAAGGHGSTLLIPPGTYNWGSAVSHSFSGVRFLGNNKNGCVIRATFATGDMYTANEYYNSVENITFSTLVERTSGSYAIHLPQPYGRVDNVLIYGTQATARHWGGIHLGATSILSTVNEVEIRHWIGVGVHVNGAGDKQILRLTTDNAASNTAQAGVRVSATASLLMDNCNIIHAGNALDVAPATGVTIPSIKATNCFFDNSVNGLSMQSAGFFYRSEFTNCWFSSMDVAGVNLQPTTANGVNGVTFTNCEIYQNVAGTTNGILTNTNVGKWKAIACNIAGWTNGINLVAGTNHYPTIIANTIGAAAAFSNNGTGISIGAGAYKGLFITANDVSDNTTAGIMNNGAVGSTMDAIEIASNTGHLLKGLLNSTIAAYTTTSTTEGVVVNARIPANSVVVGQIFRLKLFGTTSTTSIPTSKVRFGTAGTTADTVNQSVANASAAAGGLEVEFLVNFRAVGASGAAWVAGTTTLGTARVYAAPAALTVNTTQAFFISLTLQVSAGTGTVWSAFIEAL